jgi:hypothetical protein
MWIEELNNPVGRPSIYTKELAEEMCRLIANGMSVRELCRRDDMPGMSTFFEWAALKSDFAELYAKAKKAQVEFLGEELLDIADDGTNDWLERLGDDGKPIGYAVNGEHIQRSRLRIDTRKWVMAKLMPRKYGDKLETETTVNVVITDAREAVASRIAGLAARTDPQADPRRTH